MSCTTVRAPCADKLACCSSSVTTTASLAAESGLRTLHTNMQFQQQQRAPKKCDTDIRVAVVQCTCAVSRPADALALCAGSVVVLLLAVTTRFVCCAAQGKLLW